MKDIKALIKALEVCREMRNPPGYRNVGCVDCPYQKEKHPEEKYYNCINRMLEDATETLKELGERRKT